LRGTSSLALPTLQQPCPIPSPPILRQRASENDILLIAGARLLTSVTKASYYYLHPYVMICNTRPACSITAYIPTIPHVIAAIVALRSA